MLHILGAKGFVKIDIDKEKGVQVPLFNFDELKEWAQDKDLVRYMPAMAFLMFVTGRTALYLAENPEEIAALGEEIGSKFLVKRAPVIAEKIIEIGIDKWWGLMYEGGLFMIGEAIILSSLTSAHVSEWIWKDEVKKNPGLIINLKTTELMKGSLIYDYPETTKTIDSYELFLAGVVERVEHRTAGHI